MKGKLQEKNKKETKKLITHTLDGMKALTEPLSDSLNSSAKVTNAIYGLRFGATPKHPPPQSLISTITFA